MRLGARLLALCGIVPLTLGPVTARAEVDLAGRWNVTMTNALFGPSSGTFTFIPSGASLTIVYELTTTNGTPVTSTATNTGGTLDPETGDFSVSLPAQGNVHRQCPEGGIVGTSDGTTVAGELTQFYPTMQACIPVGGPFTGSRTPPVCGDGLVEGGEECDDRNALAGDCCSSTCRLEPAGAACDDRDPCTVTDACDGAGSCTGSGRLECAPCETCRPFVGCAAGPEPGCAALSGRASLALDLAKVLFTFSARAPGVDLSAPTSGDFGICVFTGSGGSWSPLFSARAPGGGRCRTKACWTTRSNGTRYRNPARTPDGLSLVSVQRSGRKAGATVIGGGPHLKVGAPLPKAIDAVRVQLRGTGTRVATPAAVARPAQSRGARSAPRISG